MQQARLEKKLKEEREHKERMAKMKTLKKPRQTNIAAKRRGGFDRSKLSGAFMTNAKAGNDNVAGWGMDFANPTQEAKQED